MSSTHYECDKKEYGLRNRGRIPRCEPQGADYILSAKAEIAQKAIEVLAGEPEGLRHSILLERLKTELPGIPVNTIRGNLVGLSEYKPAEVYRPARGLFQHTKYREVGNTAAVDASPAAPQPREEDFYAAFAEHLVSDLEECTKCISLGGCVFQDKWGTPDVIGVRKARESDIIKFPTEIVAAEIKLDPRNLITAFGQACSYRLFSHRCYLVVPKSSPTEDLARLESLCLAVGLGLVLFNSQDTVTPEFTIRVRASRNEPDPFYVNRNLKLVEAQLFS
jgi:hypothetical protein